MPVTSPRPLPSWYGISSGFSSGPKFGLKNPLPEVTTYASAPGGRNPNGASLFKADRPDLPFNWFFLHRESGQGAVHGLTLLRDSKTGERHVQLMMGEPPPMGGKTVIHLPSGTWRDENPEESLESAAKREVMEETGLITGKARLLADQFFATSPGITTEVKAYTFSEATGTLRQDRRTDSERKTNLRPFTVPLTTFLEYDRFRGWLKEMHEQGFIVGNDVLAARGLMPADLSVPNFSRLA